MIVATMDLDEKHAHVRAEVDRVLRKHQRTVDELRRALRTSRDKQVRIHQSDYRSPAQVDWVVTVRVGKKSERIFLSAWWHVVGAGLEALTLSPTGGFYFDSHFFQRYRLRETDVQDPVANLKRFLRTNYDVTMKVLDTERHGLREAAGLAREGLYLGTVRNGGLLACDTYLAQDMLHADQQRLAIELSAHAATKDWSDARRQQFKAWAAVNMKPLLDAFEEGPDA